MTKSKTPLKNTMKMTLLFMDVIVLLAVFIGVFFLFEYVIKDILVKYNIQAELSRANIETYCICKQA